MRLKSPLFWGLFVFAYDRSERSLLVFMTVKLKFHSPPGNNEKGNASAKKASAQEEILEEVPMRVAWQMALDFDRYHRDGPRGPRHKSYRYLQAGR